MQHSVGEDGKKVLGLSYADALRQTEMEAMVGRCRLTASKPVRSVQGPVK